jgi:signal transduction histidine kinase
VKYAPESSVRVTVSHDRASMACVEIADTGPGMDPQDAAHAFDRFYRGAARSEVDGSGLGLAIAKIAVERAGGKVSLDTAPGKGTTVRFCLPLAAIDQGRG